MLFKEMVLQCRSYRRFYEDAPVEMDALRDLVDTARFVASGSNKQPLKYILCNSIETNIQIFSCLRWAGQLKDWGGPIEGEHPAAYIVVLGDKDIQPSFGVDHGIAAQTILLGAVEKGFGGCMLGAVDRVKLTKLLNIASNLEILLVIALGKPKEVVVIDPLVAGKSSAYWRDAKHVHHVPKRQLDDVIVAEY
ncbi:MAG: nitroreductase family protein [Dehalococcoidales bacterium]|nr:nitroreductase family protein [Dehalococcoidales bacterium]